MLKQMLRPFARDHAWSLIPQATCVGSVRSPSLGTCNYHTFLLRRFHRHIFRSNFPWMRHPWERHDQSRETDLTPLCHWAGTAFLSQKKRYSNIDRIFFCKLLFVPFVFRCKRVLEGSYTKDNPDPKSNDSLKWCILMCDSVLNVLHVCNGGVRQENGEPKWKW